MSAPFARVERTGLGYFEVVAGEKRLAEFNSFSLVDEDVARAEALANKFCERVNLSFHARCAPLLSVVERIARTEMSMHEVLNDLIKDARKALEAYRK